MKRPDGQIRFITATGRILDRMPDKIGIGTTSIIFNELREVLLQKRTDNGFWALPGGRVDVGESVEQGAIREVLEETGLTVSVNRFIGIYSDPKYHTVIEYPGGDIVQFVSVVFECERMAGELGISEESTDIGYFSVNNLPESTLISHLIRIRDSISGQIDPFVR